MDDDLPEPTPPQLFTHLLRNDLSFFIRKVFGSVAPGSVYRHNWHIDAIAYHLDRVRSGEITRLIITMPPRYMKSICASVALPAYVLGHDPAHQIICVSYAQDLATKHANDTRAVMREGWYRLAFPQTQIDKDTEGQLTTTRRGSRLATSVGGVLTGRGGNLIIVDDPIKPQDAMSELARAKAKEWMENTLFTRLDDKRTGAIVVVMQRLHEDDPVGQLLDKGGWTHLNLPAEADADESIPIGDGESYVRKRGELLHAEREPKAALEQMKVDLGSATYNAQYQQAPVSPEGNLVRWEWFKTYNSPPTWDEDDRYIVSWDTAMKSGDLSSYSVGTVWHVKNDWKEFYLVDIDRGKYDYPTLRTRVVALHKRWKANVTVVEDKGSGTSLVQDIKRDPAFTAHDLRVRWIKPEGDKIMRMSRVSPKIEDGHVFLPKEAKWLDAFRAEVMAFPRGKHDDQVDSLSQFLEYVRTRRVTEYISRPIY